MAENGRPITPLDLENEAKQRRECLSQARLLCVDIRNAGRFLGRELDSDAFADRTFETWRSLFRKCNECRGKPSAVGFIQFATAGTSPPIRFNDWTVATAHEAACCLLQDIICNYDPITTWDELGERRGYPYTEIERVRDCRQLAEWAGKVTDEFIEDTDVRIDMEHIVALKWLDSKAADTPDIKTDNKIKKRIIIPDDPAVLKLAKKINRELPNGGTKTDIIRDFAGNDKKEFERLSRALRRYPGLLE